MSNNIKLANPGPVGLFGFAITTCLLSVINAGLANPGDLGFVLPMAFVFGGIAQFIAGLFEYKRGNTLGFVAFIGYGSFWLSWGVFVIVFSKLFSVSSDFVGLWLILWGLFTLILFVASLAKAKALQSILFFLTLTYIALAIGDGLHVPEATVVGGYLGLITAICAGYLGAAETINDSFGRKILPIGEPKVK